MALYWVGYDLDKPGQQYQALINRLVELGARKILLSDWLLVNTATPEQIRNDLDRFLDKNDRIIVAELKNNAAWRNLLLSNDEVQRLFANCT
ncbi:MAG: hypothetical protein LAN63_12040 [Acidobacteriia bacterium]|nr:hypothetical protein [Terriglobia bacterium]